MLLHGNGASVHDSLLIIAPDIKAPSLELTSAGFVSAVQFTSKGEAKQNGNRYQQLPANAYTLPDNGVVTFAEAATTATMEVTFNRDAMQMGEYILPLTISNPNVEGMEIKASQKTVLLGVSYSPDKLVLKADQLHCRRRRNRTYRSD